MAIDDFVVFLNIFSSIANKNGFNVVPHFIGHGIGTYFHGPPDILHFSKFYLCSHLFFYTLIHFPYLVDLNNVYFKAGLGLLMSDYVHSIPVRNSTGIVSYRFTLLTRYRQSFAPFW